MPGKHSSLRLTVNALTYSQIIDNLKKTLKGQNNLAYLYSGIDYARILSSLRLLPGANRGCIFSCVRPFYERALSDLDP
jgi:hypothetical protein